MENEPKNDSKLQLVLNDLKQLTLPEIIVILISGYLFSNIALMLTAEPKAYALDFVNQFSLTRMLTIILCYTYIVYTLKLMFDNPNIYYYFFMIISGVYGTMIILEGPRDIFFTIIVVAIVGYIFYYCSNKISPKREPFIIPNLWMFLIIILCFLGMTTALSIATVSRQLVFHSSTFDMGIFTQMYESMRTNGTQMTTLERGEPLSHFAIHFCLMFYALLPGYFIFPSPSYLLIMQASVILSGVFPVYFLCKHYKFTSIQQAFVSLTYLFYPGVIAGQFYDFHETLFMPPLLLWMIYFYEKKKIPFMYLFMFLVLMVKEDAPLYLVFWGLFLIFDKEDYIHGFIVSGLSLISFGIVSTLMTIYGRGIMMNRFDLFLQPGEDGAVTFIKNLLINPTFALRNILSLEKFTFVMYMMAPLLLMPLISKKYSRLLLVAPLLLLNLMTNYPYQFDIGYQYTFAPAALLFFLYIYNTKELNKQWRQLVITVAVISSFAFMMTTVNDKLTYYSDLYKNNKEFYDSTAEMLKTVPKNATVISETFFTSHLGFVENLYDFPSDINADYVILYQNNGEETNPEKLELLKRRDYQLIGENGLIMLYKASDYE